MLAGPCCSTQSVVGGDCEIDESKCWSQGVASGMKKRRERREGCRPDECGPCVLNKHIFCFIEQRVGNVAVVIAQTAS